jgi:hypothetical protein
LANLLVQSGCVAIIIVSINIIIIIIISGAGFNCSSAEPSATP